MEKTVRKGIEPKSQADIVFTGPIAVDAPHQVALQALGLVLDTRLRESLREALSGTYGVQVAADASKIPEARYDITIDFGCDPERTEELVKTLFREIDTLKANGPTEREVSDAREALLREHESDLAQNDHLADEIAERYRPVGGHRGVLRSAGGVQEADGVGCPGRGAQLPGHRQLRAGDAVSGEGAGKGRAKGRSIRLACCRPEIGLAAGRSGG